MDEELEKIRKEYENENYSDCLLFSDNLLKTNRDHFEALSYKASSQMHLGLYGEAVNTFSKCLSKDATKFYIWVLRGDAYEKMGEARKAFDDYWHSLQLEPNNGAVLDKMARILFNLGNENGALGYIKKAIEIGESPEPMLVMMAMLNKMGMYGFLHELYDVGIKKFPEKIDDFNRYRSRDLFQN